MSGLFFFFHSGKSHTGGSFKKEDCVITGETKKKEENKDKQEKGKEREKKREER